MYNQSQGRTMIFRRKQDRKHKKRLKRMSEYALCVGYYDADDEYNYLFHKNYDGRKSFVYRHNMSGVRKYCKKMTSRKVRHYKGELTSPSDYQKLFDYYWTLY